MVENMKAVAIHSHSNHKRPSPRCKQPLFSNIPSTKIILDPTTTNFQSLHPSKPELLSLLYLHSPSSFRMKAILSLTALRYSFDWCRRPGYPLLPAAEPQDRLEDISTQAPWPRDRGVQGNTLFSSSIQGEESAHPFQRSRNLALETGRRQAARLSSSKSS